jgi:hypothetical protein
MVPAQIGRQPRARRDENACDLPGGARQMMVAREAEGGSRKAHRLIVFSTNGDANKVCIVRTRHAPQPVANSAEAHSALAKSVIHRILRLATIILLLVACKLQSGFVPSFGIEKPLVVRCKT